MKEEDIDSRIQRVIESVSSKKKAICQWESERIASEVQRKVATKRWRTYGISAAASVVVCAIGIGLYLNRPGEQSFEVTSSVPAYRGSSTDIEEIKALIDSRKYQDAIQAIDATMADTIIDTAYPEDRKEYLRCFNRSREYELTWLKIKVLVKLDKNHEAISLLETFVQNEGTHQIESRKLLEKLQE